MNNKSVENVENIVFSCYFDIFFVEYSVDNLWKFIFVILAIFFSTILGYYIGNFIGKWGDGST